MIQKIIIKYDEFTTLSEVDDYVKSIIGCCERNNQIIANTDFISDGLVITIKTKLQLVKK
tara:strand:- start:125 stop:304 length:180 start_codon:yes stop_codon:yes gene_type:complete